MPEKLISIQTRSSQLETYVFNEVKKEVQKGGNIVLVKDNET